MVKRWNALTRRDDWIEECEMCRMPSMLHKGLCTRKEGLNMFEVGEVLKAWSLFKAKMKPILQWQENQEEKTRMQSNILVGMKEIVESQNVNMGKMIDIMDKKENRTAKIVKPARVLA